MLNQIGLWKHNSTTGYWTLCRMCDVETKTEWFSVFQKDEPKAWFKLSKNKPSACGNRKIPT